MNVVDWADGEREVVDAVAAELGAARQRHVEEAGAVDRDRGIEPRYRLCIEADREGVVVGVDLAHGEAERHEAVASVLREARQEVVAALGAVAQHGIAPGIGQPVAADYQRIEPMEGLVDGEPHHDDAVGTGGGAEGVVLHKGRRQGVVVGAVERECSRVPYYR